MPFCCSDTSYLRRRRHPNHAGEWQRDSARDELPHEAAVGPHNGPLGVNEGKRSPETQALQLHEHGQQHGGAAADARSAVEADGLAALEERGAEIAHALEIRGCLAVWI